MLAKNGVVSVVVLGALLYTNSKRGSSSVLLIVAIDSEVLFQDLVGTFGLSVTF